MENKHHVTINDIAELAGVSKRTVSRVLNGSPSVGAKTREKIQQVIDDHNYQPDKQARGLASKRSFLLGLIYDNPDALYIDQVQRGALQICTKLGYELIVHPCDWKSENFVEGCLDFVARSRVDGVLILPPVSESKLLANALKEQDYKYVRIASADLDDHSNIVISNDRKAMKEIADHLVGFGHRDIAIISGPKMFCSSAERLEGLLDSLKNHNIKIPKRRILEGKNSYESGIQCAQKLLAMNPRPTAIYANNDEMATGVMRVAHDLGIRIPEDLSIVGFDDNIIASRVLPSLTTIRRPVEEIASIATDKLITSFQTDTSSDRHDWNVTPFLVSRDSTGPAKN
jgi:LacI family transcriptional regulator